MRWSIYSAIVGVMLFASAALAADVTFEKDVLPLLEKRCQRCHGAELKKAELDLGSYRG